MSFPEREEIIRFLANRNSYEHKPEKVEHIQTHASDIFIADQYVYKIKKPVNFGFLDFSTLHRREFFCEREVELNRRLCDDIYLGVERICKRNGDYCFNGEGGTLEVAVKMRRLDDKYFLKNILRDGKAEKDHFIRVIDKLEDFYKGQEVSDEVLERGKPGHIMESVDDNVKSSSDFIGNTISAPAYSTIDSFNELFFRDGEELFLSRMEEGFIKDCHGDLHLEHINICPDRICIYDCIEFNDTFREIDIASDIAFLAMDLDFNDHPGFSDLCVHEISVRMNDSRIYELLDFYKCYRAFVRGKVESIKSCEDEVPEDERKVSREKASKYFRLALRYALFGSRPCVIVVFGVIGTGKSTVANMIAAELNANVYSSDVTRKEIAGMSPTDRDKEGYGRGIYSPEITEQTYTEIINNGFDNLGFRGISVIDATFSKRKWRERVLEEAEKTDTPYIFIQTTIPENTIRERLAEREKRGNSVSDAGEDMLDRFLEGYEKPEELDSNRHIRIDTRGKPEDIITEIFKKIISLD